MRLVAPQLIRDGRVRRSWLGIVGQTVRFPRAAAQRAQLAVQSGVLVTQVEPGSPAAAAGLAARDVIVRLAGSVISDVDDLQRVLTGELIGVEAELATLRAGEQHVVRVTLGDADLQARG